MVERRIVLFTENAIVRWRYLFESSYGYFMEDFELQGIAINGSLSRFKSKFPNGTLVYDRNAFNMFLDKSANMRCYNHILDMESVIFNNLRDAQRTLGIYCKKNKIKFKYSKRGDCVKR